MSAAQEAAGAQLVIGTITGISTAAGAVTGVKVQQQQQQGAGGSEEVEVAADVVVLAMGPWTDAARHWLPTAPELSGTWGELTHATTLKAHRSHPVGALTAQSQTAAAGVRYVGVWPTMA
jgi:glycerol-3-phosphate dehydrogenase